VTLPLDDTPVDERDDQVLLTGPAEAGTVVVARVEAPPEPTRAPSPTPRRAERRFLPGIWFPIGLYAMWRALELAVSLWLGGDAQYSAFNYDSQHYLRIMHIGYVHPRWTMPSQAFFPAVSWLGWPLWKLTGSDLLTVHTVATVTGLAAFITVWGVSRSLRDERIARRAVLLFALFPSSLFLWGFYSEGLFIALGAGAVWADRRGRRGLATVLFVFIGATRSVGILVPAVVVLARIIRQRRIDCWCVAYAAAGFAGLAAVLWMMHAQVGDAFAFMKVQKDWGRSLSMPWTTVIQGVHNLWPRPGTIMIPSLVARNFDLWCVAIVLLGIGYAIFSRRDRFPMEVWMLGVAMIVLPLCSSVLASFNRFTFGDWVLFPIYASAIDRLPKPWRIAAMAAIATALVLTAYAMVGRFSIGQFVG
jgi:hypothetical protein